MGCFVSCRISFSTDKHVAWSLCHSRATCFHSTCTRQPHRPIRVHVWSEKKSAAWP